MNPSKLTAAQIKKIIPGRPSDSHKGKNGHLLVIAGSKGMSGAAALVALGALKTGAGLVSVACTDEVQNVVRLRLPEAMTLGVSEIFAYLKKRRINALAIGPGLGIGRDQKQLIRKLLTLGLPTVLDADGLNNCRPADLHRCRHLIITPHPGEFERLTGKTSVMIKKEGIRLAESFAREQKVVCVLKGHRTITTNGQITWMNTTGNAAMATGGMGDVLAGIIGSFLAQGLSVLNAAAAGVFIHGLAGDLAAVSDRGLLATELALAVPLALKYIGLKREGK